MGANMNPFELLKNFNMDSLKQQAEEMKTYMENLRAVGEAGGGFVKVTVDGNFNILSIDYEDNEFIKQDLSMFRDLIIAAQNDAVSKIRQLIKDEVGEKFPLAGSFGL